MLYVVCMYIAICGLALVFLPINIPEERAKKGSIFDKSTSVNDPEADDIERKVKEHLKDVPDLSL